MANLEYITNFMPYEWHEGRMSDKSVIGNMAELQTAKWVNEVTDKSDFILNNILVPNDASISRDTEVDLIWLGKGGVTIIEVKGYAGTIEVGNGAKWKASNENGKNWEVDNPINQCMRQCKEVREFLKNNGVVIPVSGLIFMPFVDGFIVKDRTRLPVLCEKSELRSYKSKFLNVEKLNKGRIDKVLSVLKGLDRL